MAKRQTKADKEAAADQVAAQATADQAQGGADQAPDGTDQPTAGQGDTPADGGADPEAQDPEQPENTGDAGGADPDDDEDDDGDDEAADPPAPPAAAPPATAAADAPARQLVPQANGTVETLDHQKALLLEACERYDVDPTIHDQEGDGPQELGSWQFYKADQVNRIPASVVLVTRGGVKVRYYADQGYMADNCSEPGMDLDTEDRLARLFGAFTKDPKTKEVKRLPLPEDLALPPQAKTGISGSSEHTYRKGYLREGGKQEADRREAKARQARKKAATGK